MKSALHTLAAFVLLAVFPFFLNAQNENKIEVEISKPVVKTADWAGFKYMEKVDLAQRGDYHAMRDLLNFSGTVDGTEAIQHAVTCLELIPYTSDETVASVISVQKPKLKNVLLERYTLAQSRTKKEELRKPLQEWAPLTWDALHGKMIIGCMTPSTLTKMDSKDSKGEKEASAAHDIPRSKQ